MRAGKWHDVVVKSFHIDTTGAEAKFNAGEVLAARHILFMVPQTATPAQSDSVRKVAEGVRAQVTPSNFTEMATKYTQEPGGAQRGGDLGVFPKGAMVPQFEQAVAALKPGQVSPLVKTQFGYHIIRRSTYPEVAPEVASRLNGPALQSADSIYITKLETAGNIQFKPNAVATIKEAAKDLDAHRADKTVIATSKAGDFTVARLTRWLEAFQQREDLGKRLQSAPDSIVLSFVEERVAQRARAAPGRQREDRADARGDEGSAHALHRGRDCELGSARTQPQVTRRQREDRLPSARSSRAREPMPMSTS